MQVEEIVDITYEVLTIWKQKEKLKFFDCFFNMIFVFDQKRVYYVDFN